MGKPRNLESQIKELRSQGLSYRQIAEKLNCNKSAVCYHLGKNQKERFKKQRNKDRKKAHPLHKKVSRFKQDRNISKYKQTTIKFKKSMYEKVRAFNREGNNKLPMSTHNFTVEQVLVKIGDNPKCYLTGDSIDLMKTKSYNLDHIIPSAKGGENTLDNLGLATRDANMCKSDLTLEEFTILCKKVLENQGFTIIAPK